MSMILKDGRIVKSGQSVYFTYIVEYDNAYGGRHKLRFMIKSDAYIDQSYGRVDRWSEQFGWQGVASLRGTELECGSGLYVHKDYEDEHHWEADYDKLQRLAKIVLG